MKIYIKGYYNSDTIDLEIEFKLPEDVNVNIPMDTLEDKILNLIKDTIDYIKLRL